MQYIQINGKKRLQGTVKIAGAKNAGLPIIMASILGSEKIVLRNIPNLTDIENITLLLGDLGYNIIKKLEDEESGTQTITILPVDEINYKISAEVASAMRASIWALGPMLAKHGKVIIPFPGGCKLGARAIDMHIDALQHMGAIIYIENDEIIAETKSRLKSINYSFSKVSVGATANILMASTLAEGTTILSNCAIEPEITDLANFLNSIGAKISGIGTQTLKIDGLQKLFGSEYTIIPDRLEAATYAVAAAITNGDIIIENIDLDIMHNVINCLKYIGVDVSVEKNIMYVKGNVALSPLNICTSPYPGFPTDMQAQFSALLTLAKGTSEIEETIFENRFKHLQELKNMGANIHMINNHKWIINGVDKISGTKLFASDLRGAASLIIAALGADGISEIYNLEYLDRGYANLDKKLLKLGADIYRVDSEKKLVAKLSQ